MNETNDTINLEDIYPTVSFQVGNVQIEFTPLKI